MDIFSECEAISHNIHHILITYYPILVYTEGYCIHWSANLILDIVLQLCKKQLMEVVHTIHIYLLSYLFTDLAVGAPYGGSRGQGAVYVFHGSRMGLKETASQVRWAGVCVWGGGGGMGGRGSFFHYECLHIRKAKIVIDLIKMYKSHLISMCSGNLSPDCRNATM